VRPPRHWSPSCNGASNRHGIAVKVEEVVEHGAITTLQAA
jgi:hypothetical protein